MSPILSHEAVSADADAAGPLYYLHGVFGSGRNWRSVARRVAEETGVDGLLVDLRLHGDSIGFLPPHTIDACAEDVRALADAVPPPRAVLGHSFGGKVALALGERPPASLRQLWIVDADPSAREPGGQALGVLEALREHPGPFEDRDEAVRSLQRAGFESLVARWMATNLEERDEGLRWGLNLDGIEALLEDFARRDLWPAIEDPSRRLQVHVVKAEGSDVIDEASCRRIEEAGRRHGRTHLHRLEGGHWLNVANPEGLVELIAGRLVR